MTSDRTPERETRLGVALATSSYVLWGVAPMWFKLIDYIEPWEIVAHRVMWGMPFAAVALAARRRLAPALAALRDLAALRRQLICALLISINWGTFIWAVSEGRILDASFGYFINPIFSVLIGRLLLGERLSAGQALAVGVASLGVLAMGIALQAAPMIPLVLALTFALYGYVRKTSPVGPAAGFFLETLLLSPLALAVAVLYVAAPEHGRFLDSARPLDTLALMLCGPVTAVPLMLFAAGVRRLRLAAMGLLQYIAPSLMFLLAALYYGEPTGAWQLSAFLLIWLSLAIYSLSPSPKRDDDDPSPAAETVPR